MLEGVVGSGIHGDIAIDDLTLLNGKCCKKYGDGKLYSSKPLKSEK